MQDMQTIADAFTAMKFRRTVFGGVAESDVWRQLEELQALYRKVYDEQAAYYRGLLAGKAGEDVDRPA